MSRHALGSITIAGCALSWGTIALIVKELALPPMAIVFFRVGLAAAAVASALLIARRRQLMRMPPPAVLAVGVLLAAHWSLYFAAIKETSVASAVLITYLAPVFMAMLAPVLIRERVPPVAVAALGVSLAGIVAITFSGGTGDGEVRPLGVGLALLAAVSYALLIVLLKKHAARVDAVTIVLWQSLTAALVLSPVLLFADLSLDARSVAYLAVLGVLLTGMAGLLFVSALRWVPATSAGILAYLEPVSASVLAAVVLGQSMTVGIVAGGAAIVAAGVAVVVKASDPIADALEEPVAAGR